jgi:hypothetical protein
MLTLHTTTLVERASGLVLIALFSPHQADAAVILIRIFKM